MKLFGIVLIAVGIFMIVFRGFNFTTDKKVAEIGSIEINKKEQHNVNWPYYAGSIVIVAGLFVFFAGYQKKAT